MSDTRKFPQRWMARKGCENLMDEFDGSPSKDGCYHVGKIGFETELYMTKPPTLHKFVSSYKGEVKLDPDFIATGLGTEESNLTPRAFKIAKKLKAREFPFTLLSTEDQSVVLKSLVLDNEVNRSKRFVNVDADTVWFIYSGNGYCDTTLGRILFHEGDAIYIPAHITYAFNAFSKIVMVGMESTSFFEYPRPRKMDNQTIPFDGPMMRIPDPVFIEDEFDELSAKLEDSIKTEFLVYVKRAREWSVVTYPFSPFDCVAWKGTVYPFALDLRRLVFSYTTRNHADPCNFAVFAAQDFSAVISVLAGRFGHSIPYNHRNRWEEFLFYAKKYEARAGSEIGEGGDATFHPEGLWHGPQLKAMINWLKNRPISEAHIPFLEEFAVMFESSNPLLLCKDGYDIREKDYERSWYEGWQEYNEELHKNK